MNLFDAVKEIPILDVAKDVGITITKHTGGYAMAVCPFHEDHKGGGGEPNLSLMVGINRFKCHKCGEKGSVLDLWMKTSKQEDAVAAAKAMAAQYHVTYDDEGAPKEKPPPGPKKWKQDKYIFKTWDEEAVEKAHQNLLDPGAAGHLEHLLKIRHLTLDYVKAKKIGMASIYAIDQDDQYDFAYTIPAFDTDGTLLAIRLHSRFVRKHKKFVSGKKMKNGSEPTCLYDLLSYKPDQPELWICEGEGDLWTLESMGKNVVSTLCGASSVANTLAKDQFALGDLEKKDRIVLTEDNDHTGFRAMARVRVAMPKTAKVWRVHWPDDYMKKEDVSFWFHTLGKSFAEFEQLLQVFTFEEAEAWLKLEQEKEEAKKKGTLHVYEFGNCYFRLNPKKKPKKEKKPKGAEEPEAVVPLEDKEHNEEEPEDLRLTTFVIHGKATVEIDREGYTRADIETVDGKTEKDVFLSPETWLGKKEFMKQFLHTKYVFQGTDRDVQDIMQLATKFIKDDQVKKGVRFIGFVDHHFVGPKFIISQNGVVEDGPFEYIPQGVPLDTAIKIYTHENVVQVLKDFCDVILKVNKPEVIVPTLGWMFACFFKEQIHKLIHYFPILSFFGTSGAGKTSFVLTMMRLFGMSPDFKLFNANATRFSAMRMLSSTNTIPVPIDELKENIGKDQVNFWQQRLKNVYFGETETRGNKNQTISSYDYKAPLLILGEMSIVREQAIAERTIAVRPERFVIDGRKDIKNAFHHLDKEIAVEALFPKIVQWILKDGLHQMKEAWTAVSQELAAMKVTFLSPRVWHNFIVILFGINMLERFAKSLGVVFMVPAEMKKEAVVKLASALFSVGSRPKIAFDEFIEAASIMARTGVIQTEKHYLVDQEILYIHLNSCVPAYRKWARETHWDGEVLGRTELYNQAKEVEKMNPTYVVDASRSKRLSAFNQCRCAVVNLKKAGEMKLDVSGFGYIAEHEPESWQKPADPAPERGDQPEPELPPELTEENKPEGDMFGDLPEEGKV